MGCYLHAQGSYISYKSKVEACTGKKAWINNFFLNLYLEKFNSFTNLFNPNSDLDRYARMINKLQGLSVLTSAEQKAALSFIILFDSHEELNINNVDTEFNKTLYNSCIKTREHCLDLKSLSIALVDMAAFCSQNITWDIMNDDEISNKDDVSTFAHFNLYTGDEESWIRMQFKLVDEAFRSVSGGEKLFHEFLACSAGISPLPKDHIPTLLRVLYERAWRVFKIHPEFEALPYSTQRWLMELNSPLAVALCILKAETCSSGLEQLQERLGELDEKRWRLLYLPHIENPSEIKTMSLTEDPSIPQETLWQLHDLAERLKILTIDPDMYKLNLLLILTKQPVSVENPGMDRVHARYETLLKRRVSWLCQQDDNFGDSDQIICNIFACQKLLSQFAELLQAIVLRF
jgi:hypothetical protein